MLPWLVNSYVLSCLHSLLRRRRAFLNGIISRLSFNNDGGHRSLIFAGDSLPRTMHIMKFYQKSSRVQYHQRPSLLFFGILLILCNSEKNTCRLVSWTSYIHVYTCKQSIVPTNQNLSPTLPINVSHWCPLAGNSSFTRFTGCTKSTTVALYDPPNNDVAYSCTVVIGPGATFTPGRVRLSELWVLQ